jgi:hypothetical protein
VPLPHGNGEQRLNAAPIEDAGGGLVVDDASLSPEWIRDTLIPVLLDPELVAAMSRAAARAGHRDADNWLAEAVLGVLRDEPPRGGGPGHGGVPEPGSAPGHDNAQGHGGSTGRGGAGGHRSAQRSGSAQRRGSGQRRGGHRSG